MPRIGRIVVKDYPHHITQRGNYRNAVFIDEVDYERYLKWLDIYAKENGLLFLAYCLMPNHVHFIAIPQNDTSLARTFNTTHMRYSQHFNRKKRSFGHLWQGRFYSCVLDEQHLYAAIKYIENNPVRAGLAKTAVDWNWSSARYHITGKNSLLSLYDVDKYIKIDSWEEYLTGFDANSLIQKIKANTLTGRPLGNDMFVARIEEMFHMRLRPLVRGRPKKKC